MITKAEAVKQVLATIPASQKITLADAVVKANAIKALKNKNISGTWRFHFIANGAVVTKDETGIYVSAPVVVEPSGVFVDGKSQMSGGVLSTQEDVPTPVVTQ